MSRRPSLALRLGLAMALVVLLTTALAAVLTGPLLRASTERAARDGLAREADLLSRIPVMVLDSGRAGQLAADEDLRLGVVDREGTATGAARALDPEALALLAAGRPVSTQGRLDGADLLLEARPSRLGGAVVLATDTSSVTDTVARQRRRVLLALVLGLVGGLAVAGVVARWLARPLTSAAAAARRLAAGERGVPLPDPPVRELADMTDALAHLDTALAGSEDRQRRFLLSVSHELRTPLTAVRGYAEALADGAVDPEEMGEVGEVLTAEAARLERYVGDLLDLARLSADDFTIEVAPVDLGRLVADLTSAWSARARAAGLVVEQALPDVPLVVMSDAGRLRQLLDVLVDNAVRVCPAGSRVVVQVSPSPIGAVVEVRDSGPGLTDDDLAVAFTPGALGERYAGERATGHGLGLSIARRLAERLGGGIRVGHAAEGGATFTVDLPSDPGRP